MAEIIDHWITTEHGRLFARSWTPDAASDKALAPILLFHDSIGCVALWRDFPALLSAATGRRVIAYDRLGFGQSDPREGKLPLDFVAQEARESVPLLCESLHVDRFVAIGHSVGGGMAIETAALWPDRVTALVTIAAQTFVEDFTLEGIRLARKNYADPANLARLARYHGDKTEWALNSWIGTWLSPEFASWNVDRALGLVHCPILAVHGETDEYGSTEHPVRIAGEHGRAVILEGVGHVPHREAPDRLVALIADFLTPTT